MRLEAPRVRIVDVETCDFSQIPAYDTAAVLEAARPAHAARYLTSAVSRRLISQLGVSRRHLTQLPGAAPHRGRLNALDLAQSAVQRMQARGPHALQRLDALIFVSTSNPNPCNSQAALLAEACGIKASCLDIKAGCSGGVLGVLQAALRVPQVGYIGVMGSRRTHDDRMARLREVGISDSELSRLSSPIGLDLGARTPEETAVSIAAEIIARRWGGGGRPLTETTGRIHHEL